jgi:predicted ATP-dependent endonuclease of OLD family
MRLVSTHISSFKSIDDSTLVSIDPKITVLVGKNESGKTAFLEALHKARALDKDIKYNPVDDYPRRKLLEYQQKHEKTPSVVVELEYELTETEIEEINDDLGYKVLITYKFKVSYKYDNSQVITMTIPEVPFIKHIVGESNLSTDIKDASLKAYSLSNLVKILGELQLNADDAEFLKQIKQQFFPSESTWTNRLELYVWNTYFKNKIPKFIYFDDYHLLPGVTNLVDLQNRVAQSNLEVRHKAVLGLLRLARITLNDLVTASSYAEIKAKLEGFSNAVTDRVLEFWKQNPDIEVEFDIREDPRNPSLGKNLYINIRNRRHRVTVPFDQRSKGFIWFFSFIVWFDSVRDQEGAKDDVILLMDEPGLNLHALAQADFLDYIDSLASKYQVLYSTHSPFMLRPDALHQARVVEDRKDSGTRISSNLSDSEADTLFPLQAALGYTIAQNLFISKRNLLVEGPADLIYLKFFSAILEQKGIEGLRSDITIVPVGGLDKLATFIALLRGNELEMVVLHDYNSVPDPHLKSLIARQLIKDKLVLHYGMFRIAGGAPPSSDVEDMMSEQTYLRLFSDTFKTELNGANVTVADLSSGDRIVQRIESYLTSHSIVMKTSGGFNHYRPANYLAQHPIPINKIDKTTLARFQTLFAKVNALFG